MVINNFNGGYAFLSNFYNAPLLLDGIRYQNSEAAYQAGKTTADRRPLFANLSPDQAKKLGRATAIRKDWDAVRADYMRKVVHAKFTQNPTLASLLLQTGDMELEEGNTWHDNYFGNCYCPICQGIKGENMLGRILMEERAKLKEIVAEYEERKV